MRMRTKIIFGLLLALILLLAGCAPSSVNSGFDALQSANYSRARAYFELALEKNPDDLRAQEGLGEVLFYTKDYAGAQQQLQKVLMKDPKYGRASLFLGLTLEEQGDLSSAAAVYESYLLYDKDSPLARQITGRRLYVKNQELRQQVKDAIAFEKQGTAGAPEGDAVGVLPFLPSDSTSQVLGPLATGIAAAINYDLSQISSIKVVERQKLRYLLDELNLTKQGYTEAESSPRLGRIVGAEHLVSGSVGAAGGDEVSVSSGISDVAKDSYTPALQQQETMAKLLELQKKITFAIIDSLGIQLTPEERNKIGKLPTEDFDAFLAYSRGIDALDEGDYSQATEFFERATTLDPNFTQAANLQQEAQLLDLGSGTPDAFASTADVAGPGVGTTPPPIENVFDLPEPITDPRATDETSAGDTGEATVGGKIH